MMRGWGLVGVGLFFIISGYFLFPVSPPHKREFAVLPYLYSKLKQWWIPWALSVCIIWGILRTGVKPEWIPSVKELIYNMAGIQYFFSARAIEGAHWYMVQLSVFLFLIICVKKTGLRLLYVVPSYFIICITFHLFKEHLHLHNAFFSTLFGCFVHKWNFITLLMGMCLRQYQGARDKTEKIAYMIYCALLCGSLFCFTESQHYTCQTVISIIVFYIIFILCLAKKIKLFECKPLVYLGSISFYVYLMHQRIGYLVIGHLEASYGTCLSVIIACAVSVLMGIALRWLCLNTLKILSWIHCRLIG